MSSSIMSSECLLIVPAKPLANQNASISLEEVIVSIETAMAVKFWLYHSFN